MAEQSDMNQRPTTATSQERSRAPGDPAAGAPWYRDGLRFCCTSCGRCCTGSQGYVWISVAEATALAEHFSLALDDFGRRYLRRVGMRLALVDGADGACVLLQGKLCSVYELRPSQCRSFPWWPSVLASPQDWRRTALDCEGISDAAPLVAAEVIDDAARPDKTDRGLGGC